MKMTINESAKALGEMIAQDTVATAYKEAVSAYRGSKEIQNMIFEYNAQRAALGEEYKKETQDEELTGAIKARVDKLYNDIVNHPVYQEFTAAQQTMNNLIDSVNKEITRAIFGEEAVSDSDECTHDCSSCGGSCGH